MKRVEESYKSRKFGNLRRSLLESRDINSSSNPYGSSNWNVQFGRNRAIVTTESPASRLAADFESATSFAQRLKFAVRIITALINPPGKLPKVQS
jgi:hypothetical protein